MKKLTVSYLRNRQREAKRLYGSSITTAYNRGRGDAFEEIADLLAEIECRTARKPRT